MATFQIFLNSEDMATLDPLKFGAAFLHFSQTPLSQKTKYVKGLRGAPGARAVYQESLKELPF